MRGRGTARGDSPAAFLKHQRGFRLGACEGELPKVPWSSPCAGSARSVAQTLSDIRFGQPLDGRCGALRHRIDSLGAHDLDSAGTILADM